MRTRNIVLLIVGIAAVISLITALVTVSVVRSLPTSRQFLDGIKEVFSP